MDCQKANRSGEIRDFRGVIYIVWLFKGASSWGLEFIEFSDAKTFAEAAELGVEVTKNGNPEQREPASADKPGKSSIAASSANFWQIALPTDRRGQAISERSAQDFTKS